MLIAQITDIHLGFDPDNPEEFNRIRLDRTIADLLALDPVPDILFATGDLADRGDSVSYQRLANALSVCPFPVYMCMGNHDMRANFRQQFPETGGHDGFVQYELEQGGLRFLVLDTLEEGRHGGAFCDVRAAWLKQRLAEKTDIPTIIIQHHPPVEVGIAWMNTDPEEQWVSRLGDCLRGQSQVKAILCGHIHRMIQAHWHNIPIAICPSTAPQVALNLKTIDAQQPDGRNMIIADPPAFALHWWNGRELISHFDTAEDHITLARYDENMQPLVKSLLAERPAK